MASGGPGDPQSWNRYAYTRGDPINRYDPAGTDDSTPTFTDTVWSYADDYWDYSGFQQQMYAMFCVSDPPAMRQRWRTQVLERVVAHRLPRT